MPDITDYKLSSFTSKVADLADRPALTPSQLKAAFDAAPEELKGKYNDMLDYLLANYPTNSNITTDRKLSATGDFTGTLNGLPIVAAEPGLSSTVASHTEQLADIAINAKQYGAIGDGGTDDTAAIQAAIDYAFNNNLTDVKIPDGTYLIDGSAYINLKSNITVTLSKKAILKLIPNSLDWHGIFRIRDCVNVKITGGTLIGERDDHTGTTGEWGYGVWIDQSSFVEISDMSIQDFWGDGIAVGEIGIQSHNVIIRNVISDNNRRQGLSLIHCHDVLVDTCIFSNTNGTAPEAGIDIEPGLDFVIYNIKVKNCIIYGNAGEGIQVYKNVINYTLDGNECHHNSLNGIKAMLGNRDGIIVNNSCHDNTLRGIYIYGYPITGNTFYDDPQNIEVRSNYVVNNGASGIQVERALSISIVGNTVKQNDLEGIYIYETNRGLVEKNDVANNTNEGIFVVNTCADVRVLRNTLKDNGGLYGIIFTGGVVNSRIEDNYIAGDTDYAIVLNGTTVVDCQVINNDLSLFTGLAGIVSGGLNCLIMDKKTIGGQASAIPTTGSWVKGQLLYNSDPASAGYIGWVCVVSGTPGTWKGFGLIQ